MFVGTQKNHLRENALLLCHNIGFDYYIIRVLLTVVDPGFLNIVFKFRKGASICLLYLIIS